MVEDFANSKFIMSFKTLKNLPENYIEMERTIKELIPCHINFDYKFKFALDNYKHNELEEFEHRVLEGAIHGKDI